MKKMHKFIRCCQFKLVFLLCVAVFSSGYRFRCFLFCEEQTGVQNNYTENRNDCRDYAQAKLDDTMANSANPDSEKAAQAAMVALFSECMNKKGWDVPSGIKNKIANANNDKVSSPNLAQGDSLAQPAIATPAPLPVPTPEKMAEDSIIKNSANAKEAAAANADITATKKQFPPQPTITKQSQTVPQTVPQTQPNLPSQPAPIPAPSVVNSAPANSNPVNSSPTPTNAANPNSSVANANPNIPAPPAPVQAANPAPIPAPETPTETPVVITKQVQLPSQPQPALQPKQQPVLHQLKLPAGATQAPTQTLATTVKSQPSITKKGLAKTKTVDAAPEPAQMQTAAPVQAVEVKTMDVPQKLSGNTQPALASGAQPQIKHPLQPTDNDEKLGSKRATECSFARRFAELSVSSAAKAEACDLECAEKLKAAPRNFRPPACPADILPKP